MSGFIPLKFFVKGMWMRLNKGRVLTAALLILTGCTGGNIKIPEEHMAPKEAKKGDSYIFLDSLRHDGKISKIGEDEEGRSRLRVLFSSKGNDVETLNLYYRDGELKKVPLESAGIYRGTEYYVAEIDVASPEIDYFFEARDGRVRYFLGETGGYLPENIERFSYSVDDTQILEVPQWSKNAVWYGIYVDSFRNASEENDPIFNEMGPEYFFQPRGKMEDGRYKSELIDRGVWRSVDALGEFAVSEWYGDFYEYEAYERNMMSKYSEEAGRNTRRYGGDLQGVSEQLSYLDDLGIEVVNLSSVFYSYSSHKSDVIDYRHISPDFAKVETRGRSEYKLLDVDAKSGKNKLGEDLDSSTWKMTDSDKLMKKLIEDADERGMKIVLDANLEYVSKRFWALKDLLLQGKNSKYRDWFFVDGDWDEKLPYEGTSTVGVTTDNKGKRYRNRWIALPDGAGPEVQEEVYRWNLKNLDIRSLDEDKNMIAVNYANPEFRRYMADALGKWIDMGAAGYRFETEGVPEDFLAYIAEDLSQRRDDLLVVRGWERSSAAEDVYFQSQDNFALGSIIIDFLDSKKRLSRDDFENAFFIYASLNTLDKVYSSPLYLDSKDTDRVFSMMVNPGRKYDSLNSPASGYMNIRPDLLDGNSVKRVKLAGLIQMTLTGSPYIYYGTEVGMWGGDAPFSRKPMLWKEDVGSTERDIYENYEANGRLNLSNVEYNKVRKYIEYPMGRNSDISTRYKTLLDFRRKNPEIFKDGKVRFLEVRSEDDGALLKDVLAYERISGDKRVIVVVNRGTAAQKVGVYTEGRGDFMEITGDTEPLKVIGKRLKVDIGSLEGKVYYN